MNVIKTTLVESILKKYIFHEKVLQYTAESTENKAERLLGVTNKLISTL